jgi:hypothetical protein
MSLQPGPSIKRGSTFTAVLDALSGDASGAVVTSWLKVAVNGREPGDAAAVAATFDVTYGASLERPDGTTGPGWTLSLDDAVTAGLQLGPVVMDVRIEVGSGVIYTPTQLLNVIERVTEPVGG